METEKFILCECYSQGLLISTINDEKIVFLNMFHMGQYNPAPNLYQRLKYAIWHIWTGKKYLDELLLSFDKAKEAGEFLIEISKTK